jgi:hypothetical protein
MNYRTGNEKTIFLSPELCDVCSTATIIKSLLCMKHEISEYVEMPNSKDLFHYLHVKVAVLHN